MVTEVSSVQSEDIKGTFWTLGWKTWVKWKIFQNVALLVTGRHNLPLLLFFLFGIKADVSGVHLVSEALAEKKGPKATCDVS